MNKKSKTNTQNVNGLNTNKKLSARIIAKKNRVNINVETIRHYKKLVTECKKDIADGIDVKRNEAMILELEESINLFEVSNNKIKNIINEEIGGEYID